MSPQVLRVPRAIICDRVPDPPPSNSLHRVGYKPLNRFAFLCAAKLTTESAEKADCSAVCFVCFGCFVCFVCFVLVVLFVWNVYQNFDVRTQRSVVMCCEKERSLSPASGTTSTWKQPKPSGWLRDQRTISHFLPRFWFHSVHNIYKWARSLPVNRKSICSGRVASFSSCICPDLSQTIWGKLMRTVCVRHDCAKGM